MESQRFARWTKSRRSSGNDNLSNTAEAKVIKGLEGNDTFNFRTFEKGFDTDVYLGSGKNVIVISDAGTNTSNTQHVDLYGLTADDKFAMGLDITESVRDRAVDKGDYHTINLGGITFDIHGSEGWFNL